MPRFDQDIKLEYPEIKALSSAEEVEHFFENLGYNIDRATFKAESLLTLSSSLLQKAFAAQQIERIVRQEDGRFEIYLVESKHVKKKVLWEQFVKSFHYQGNCNYLFVLARKNACGRYQLLNLLLIERDIPTYILKDQIYQQWSLPQMETALSARGWSFYIKPAQPNESMWRSLCGFTYTEHDAEQQHYKLMGIYIKNYKSTVKEIAKQPVHLFNNQALFSNYYLLQKLPQHETLQRNADYIDCLRAYRDIRNIYQNVSKSYSELKMEEIGDTLFVSVLKRLGFRILSSDEDGKTGYRLYSYHHGVGKPARTASSSFSRATSSQQVREDISGHLTAKTKTQLIDMPSLPGLEEIEQEEKALSYCLVYPWGRKLDSIDEYRDSLRPNEIPVAHAMQLLKAKRLDWIIVTNGKLWRLYSSKAKNSFGSYYEVNLADIAAMPQKQGQVAFQYFWYFFRAAAFKAQSFGSIKHDVKKQDKAQYNRELPSFLDTLLKESQQHAQTVELRLKERVFAKIFLYFAEGFMAYASQNNLMPNLNPLSSEEREQLLDAFFRGTLTFLYRLLVLFYAEARNLLPVSTEPNYYFYSLESMKQRVASVLGWSEDHKYYRCQRIYSKDKTILYDELQLLFHIVDKGSSKLNVPQYNGGLFKSDFLTENAFPEMESAKFLVNYKIPDVYLAMGLDNMARDLYKELNLGQFNKSEKPVTPQLLAFIDYSDLGVHQLGSIYEGLLEFKLDVLEEERLKQQMEGLFASLEGDQQELQRRKNYKEAVHKTIDLFEGSIRLRQDQRERKATGSYYTPEHIVKHIVDQTVGPSLSKHLKIMSQRILGLDRQLKKLERDIPEIELEMYENYHQTVEEFFDFHVLDPAVGSGHFLVTAVDYIAEKMAKQLHDFEHSKCWHIVSYELKLMRGRILEEMERQKIFVNQDLLDTLTLLKRYVLKNCIYGVDSNPMAVELTKVSLWLHCFTPGAPLVFLDHHIKCGNSLLGEQLQTLQLMLPEKLLLDLPGQRRIAGQKIKEANKRLDITYGEATVARDEYQTSKRLLTDQKLLLDIWLSEYFGNKHAQSVVREEAENLLQSSPKIRVKKDSQEVIDLGLAIARTQGFFHWELEFPDLYFSDEAKKGFDAVVGNPPYDLLVKEKGGRDYSLLTSGLRRMPLYSSMLGKKINSFQLFIRRGLMLLKENGYFGQIVPMSLLADQDSKKLRMDLLKNHTVIRVDAFPEKDRREERVFRDSKISSCVLVAINGIERSQMLKVFKHPGNSLDKKHGEYEVPLHDIEAFSQNSYIIPLAESSTALQLAQRLSNDQCFGTVGKYLCTHPGEIDEKAKAHFLTEDPNSGSQVLRGGNIQRYLFIATPKQGVAKYIKEETFKKEARGERAAHTQFPRIGFQRNQAKNAWRRLIFTPLPKPCYCFDSVSYYLIKEENTAFFFLALFNSKLMNWFFDIISSNNHISQKEIASLPICSMSSTRSQRERDQIVVALSEYIESGQYSFVLDEVGSYLSLKPAAVDIVRDLLATLARKMVDLNKQKQFRQQKFFSFIADKLKFQPTEKGAIDIAPISSLEGGKKLLEFAGDYQRHVRELSPDDMWKIVCKNYKRFTNFSPNMEQEFKLVYREVLTSTRLIENTLKATDRLIDDIIYKLYGLTSDEIVAVESHDSEKLSQFVEVLTKR